MRRAPWLLGAALLFWGWQAGFLLYAALMAAGLEASSVVKPRWALKDRDFERISDLSAVLLAGLTLYQFDAHGFYAIFPILQSVPFVFYPLVLAQRFSTRDRICYAALFLSIRRGLRRGRITRVSDIDVGYPFFVVCVLAASAGHRYPDWFFAGLAGLVGWMLWQHRPAPSPVRPWGLALAAAMGVGYGGQLAMVEARRSVEPLLMQIFQERLWARRDPYRSLTAIGHIGQLKISQRIIARVRTQPPHPVPPRLREAAYQIYSRQMWLAPGAKFADIEPLGGGSVWEFLSDAEPDPGEGREIRLSSPLHRGRGMLMVPNGTYRVQGLNVERLERNGLGAIQVEKGPDLVEFTARHVERERYLDRPDDDDLTIPPSDVPLFESLAARLGLIGLAPRAAVARVRAYFQAGFTYSLAARGRPGYHVAPLAEFINESRSGHCEYFATATVLLLRAAGIPARYVVGYAVKEWSPLEDAYVVRRRHAHSWASAYLDGAWEDIDTTPVGWIDLEAQSSPWWTDGYDLFAWARHKLDQWRYDDSEWVDARTLIGAALLLTALLGWRLARTTRVVSGVPSVPAPAARDWPGGDSEAYRVESELRAELGPRRADETLSEWLARAAARGAQVPHAGLLRDEVLPRHYRYRFDPAGLSEEERRALREAVERWISTRRADTSR